MIVCLQNAWNINRLLNIKETIRTSHPFFQFIYTFLRVKNSSFARQQINKLLSSALQY